MKNINRIKYITKVSILTALSFVLYTIEIPLWFAPGFYKLDFSSVIALIGSFALGPLSGVLISVLKNTLKILIIGTRTACVGEFTDVVITFALTFSASVIYKNSKSVANAVMGMLTGIVLMTVTGAVLNYYLLIPVYSQLLNMPIDTIISMGTAVNSKIVDLQTLVVYATAPFNAFKGLVCSLVTLLLYKRVSKILHA